MPELQAYICLRLITAFLLLLCVYTIIGDTGWQQNEVVYNITMNEDCFSNDTDACEPGYHLNHDNTPCHNDRKCCYCPPNTYQPWWNECVSCILCTNCSEMQKVTMHLCNITHNSVCGKHLVTTNVPEAEGTSIIPSTTQVSSHAITPEDEVVSNKLPEVSDGTKEDEDEDDEQEGTVYRFWCVNYTLAHFFTHLLCLLPGVLFIAFPSWPRDINIAIKSSYNKWKRHYYRNSGRRPNRGSGLYNPPQGN